jgi:hypothetical protein
MLEGVVVNYDLTVRDSDNSVIQFQVSHHAREKCSGPGSGRIRNFLAFFDVKICEV